MRKILSTILVAFFTLSAGLSFAANLTDEEIDNIIRRSLQHFAMFNTNNNFAMQKGNPLGTGGWKKMYVPETSADHTLTAIPRPNNDSLYLISMLDLRDDAIVIQFPAFPPEGVPRENWLPSGGKDEKLDVIMRVYAPDIEAMKTWKAPKAEKL